MYILYVYCVNIKFIVHLYIIVAEPFLYMQTKVIGILQLTPSYYR